MEPPRVATDFRRLRETREPGGASLTIGQAICNARDRVALALIRLGLTPNRITLLGFAVTCGAAVFLLLGASLQTPWFPSGRGPVGYLPLAAAGLLFVAGGLDMLDGAVARIGQMKTAFGAILDSSVDRFSDMAIFIACALHFALLGNVTYQLLAILALCNATLISYIKARAEEVIPDCSAGYWLRGERFAAVLIGCASGHVPAVLWQLGMLPGFTVLRRLTYAGRYVRSMETGQPPPPVGPEPGWMGRLQLWRRPRGSPAYDVVTGLNILYILIAPWLVDFFDNDGRLADPVRSLLGTLV